MNLEQYFLKNGRGSQTRIAEAVGVYSSDISDWKLNKVKTPIKYCKAVEEATGGQVTVKDLRPDDWFLVWPDPVGNE